MKHTLSNSSLAQMELMNAAYSCSIEIFKILNISLYALFWNAKIKNAVVGPLCILLKKQKLLPVFSLTMQLT